MQSLSRYSRGNQINKEWIDQYLNEAHSFGLTSIRAHFNVVAWSEDMEELKHIRNDVGSQLALMECKPRHNTVDAATLYWAGMPGNAGDFPSEESFFTFIEPALCFLRKKPTINLRQVHLELKCATVSAEDRSMWTFRIYRCEKELPPTEISSCWGLPAAENLFMNHMVRQYWEQGTHVVLVDTGNSYQGLCEMIRRKTKGEDGIYYTYTEESPISFNPFYTDDYVFDVEKKTVSKHCF